MFKRTVLLFIAPIAAALLLTVSLITAQENPTMTEEPIAETTATDSGYVDVNGLHMYYEIHGEGEPLVLLHGAYMTLSTFGELLPRLAETRQVIAFELQGHGRTADIDRPFSYEAMADDVAAGMDALGIPQADVFGYSMGAGVAMQLAIRHPEHVEKLVFASSTFSQQGFYPQMLAGLEGMTAEVFTGTGIDTEYARLAPDPDYFPTFVEKLVAFDKTPFDWSADLSKLTMPTLLIFGDSDIVQLQHIVELFTTLGGGVMGEYGMPNVRLGILPATAHTTVLYQLDSLMPMVTAFLDAPVTEVAVEVPLMETAEATEEAGE
jgi:pimeloyl-ACP methyl ester carboxylesterase